MELLQIVADGRDWARTGVDAKPLSLVYGRGCGMRINRGGQKSRLCAGGTTSSERGPPVLGEQEGDNNEGCISQVLRLLPFTLASSFIPSQADPVTNRMTMKIIIGKMLQDYFKINKR